MLGNTIKEEMPHLKTERQLDFSDFNSEMDVRGYVVTKTSKQVLLAAL